MKKISAILLAVVMLVSAAPLSSLVGLDLTASASDVLTGIISGTNPTMWTLDEYGTLTIIGEGEMGDFGTTETDDWSTMEDRGYCNIFDPSAVGIVPDTFIKKVIVSEGITHIANYAFTALYALEEVSLPGTLESIGAHAFNACMSLKEVSLPASLETIGSYAFKQCTSFKNIVIPDSVTTMNTEAFSGCTSLESVKLSENLTQIPFNGFTACTSLKEVVIPESVTYVSIGAFFLCPNLETVTVLNKDCTLEFMCISNNEPSEEVITPTQSKTVLKGYTGSTAQDYAERSEEYGTPITFVALDGSDVEPHVHTVEVLPAKAATCTTSGLTEGKKCSDCGITLTAQQVIPAKGHNFSTSAVTKNSTCTSAGVKTYYCEDCEATKTESIAVKAHAYGAWTTQSNATCTASGVEKRICATCGKAETRNISATGHTDANGDDVCDTCGETMPEEEESFLDKIKAFFQKIIDWFKNLFS